MEKTDGSKLMKMQARFQQKQMAEREMKIASLYEAQQARALGRVRQSPTTTNGVNTATSSPPARVPVHPGKVRQMFEERRTKAGIDKSYPLQPIHNTDRAAPRRNVANGFTKVSTTGNTKLEKKTTRTQVSSNSNNVMKQQRIDNVANGAGDLNHNHQPDFNSIKNAVSHQINGFDTGVDEADRAVNNYRLEDETFPEGLAPTPTPRSPEPKSPEPKKPPRRSPALRKNQTSQKVQSDPVPPPRRTVSENTVRDVNKARGVMQRGAKPIIRKNQLGASGSKARSVSSTVATSNTASAPGDGHACTVCGRRFAEDRLQRHEEICRKANTTKKRKPFDALKHRLAGTEAEPFINKLRKGPPPAAKTLNNNWRQTHQDFIQTIRAAKQVQSHLNAGGKLSDLPPPPPSENPDYVQCPHCNRRFNQAAAERHIPKCSSYLYNKPKPQTQPGKRR